MNRIESAVRAPASKARLGRTAEPADIGTSPSGAREAALQLYEAMPLHPNLTTAVRPQEGEALRSWLLRLAIANGFRCIKELTTGVGGGFQRLAQPNDCPRDEDHLLKVLSFELALPRSLAHEMLLTQQLQHLGDGRWKRVASFQLTTQDAVRSVQRQAVCPLCIGTAPHFWRKAWRLGVTTHCDVHGGLLLDQCTHCAGIFSIGGNRTDLTHCEQCGTAIEHMPVPALQGTTPSPFCKTFLGLPSHRPFPVARADIASWWHAIERILLVACHPGRAEALLRAELSDLHASGLYMVSRGPRQSFTRFDSAQRARLLSFAEWVLNPWPERLITVLEQARLDTASVEEPFVYGPGWLWAAVKAPSAWRDQQRAQRRLPLRAADVPSTKPGRAQPEGEGES